MFQEFTTRGTWIRNNISTPDGEYGVVFILVWEIVYFQVQ